MNADENPKRGDITLVTGVIGADTHIVGNRILSLGLEEAGMDKPVIAFIVGGALKERLGR
ncbi:MAG: hypothetical protein CMM60_05865 [Rhodospirillaceae bacterium]|nr:hypothetical protein [Rhodospirillaceae bacterium]